MRGILAVVVMLYHYGINVLIERLTGGVIANAPWGAVVDFFFILSGFVLSRAYLRNPRSITRVFIERIMRLMPVHLALMALCAPLYLAIYDFGRREIFADWSAISVFLGTERWNGPSWSINIELYLPVLLAAILPWQRRLPAVSAWVVLAILLALDGWLAYRLALGEENFLLRGIAGLATGSVLYRCVTLSPPGAGGGRWLLPALTIGMLFAILLSGWQPIIATVGPVLAALAVWSGSAARSILGRGIFAFVGALSYTIYMVHTPLKDAVLYAMGQDDFGGAVGIKLVLIAGVVLLAWLLTKLVELPGMRLGKAISRRMAPPVGD